MAKVVEMDSRKDTAHVSTSLTYEEARDVARQVVMMEQKKERVRGLKMVVFAILMGYLMFVLGFAWLVIAEGKFDLRSDNGQLALLNKRSDELVRTAESMEDRDASDLVDYDRMVEGADGAWVLPAMKMELVRTVSWWEDNKMHVQHVASIARHGGTKPRVEIVTKAGHEMIIWDSNDEHAFNIMIRRWNGEKNSFDAWAEVNAEGDSDEMGRGRVVVSLRRPRLEPTKEVNLDEYF